MSRIMSPSRVRSLVLMSALTILSTRALPALANQDKKADDAPAKGYMDEKAIEILQSMATYLAKGKTVHFELQTFYDEAMESGILVKRGKQGKMTLKRPNKLYGVVKLDDGNEFKICFNGKSLVRLNIKENTYQKLDFTGDTGAMLDHLIDNYEVDLPMADFLYNNLGRSFQEYLISAEHLGQKTVDGTLCHHLSFESSGADWQIWVEVGDKPVPRLYAITFINEEHTPQLFAFFKNWELNLEAKEQIFNFTAPPGAKQVKLEKSAPPAADN